MIKQIFAAFLLVISSFSVQASGSVDINSADAATIAEQLVGIGDAKAEAIVKYREEHGPFSSVDELVNVSGIGEKTLEKIRGQVQVSSDIQD